MAEESTIADREGVALSGELLRSKPWLMMQFSPVYPDQAIYRMWKLISAYSLWDTVIMALKKRRNGLWRLMTHCRENPIREGLSDLPSRCQGTWEKKGRTMTDYEPQQRHQVAHLQHNKRTNGGHAGMPIAEPGYLLDLRTQEP